MGGIGSGRRGYGGKATTDSYRALDVRRLHRKGLLVVAHTVGWEWSRNGQVVASVQVRTAGDRVTLEYQHRHADHVWRQIECPVALEWTACNLGGSRVWFRCPRNGCGRRVALLYFGGPGAPACRRCKNLAYQCQRESPGDRAARRADTIRHRLGWAAGIFNPRGEKPRGMHWRTFEQFTSEYDAYVGASVAGMALLLDRMKQRTMAGRAW